MALEDSGMTLMDLISANPSASTLGKPFAADRPSKPVPAERKTKRSTLLQIHSDTIRRRRHQCPPSDLGAQGGLSHSPRLPTDSGLSTCRGCCETKDAIFKPVSVVQKPMSSILEKIRIRKLEVMRQCSFLNISDYVTQAESLVDEDSPNADMTVPPIDAK